jgi:hypothetical protein
MTRSRPSAESHGFVPGKLSRSEPFAGDFGAGITRPSHWSMCDACANEAPIARR